MERNNLSSIYLELRGFNPERHGSKFGMFPKYGVRNISKHQLATNFANFANNTVDGRNLSSCCWVVYPISNKVLAPSQGGDRRISEPSTMGASNFKHSSRFLIPNLNYRISEFLRIPVTKAIFIMESMVFPSVMMHTL